MTELKNTPWRALQQANDSEYWAVFDLDGDCVANRLNQPTAKAIAALPDTLTELEALQAENERLREGQSKRFFCTPHCDNKYILNDGFAYCPDCGKEFNNP